MRYKSNWLELPEIVGRASESPKTNSVALVAVASECVERKPTLSGADGVSTGLEKFHPPFGARMTVVSGGEDLGALGGILIRNLECSSIF